MPSCFVCAWWPSDLLIQRKSQRLEVLESGSLLCERKHVLSEYWWDTSDEQRRASIISVLTNYGRHRSAPRQQGSALIQSSHFVRETVQQKASTWVQRKYQWMRVNILDKQPQENSSNESEFVWALQCTSYSWAASHLCWMRKKSLDVISWSKRGRVPS